jgi:MoxR-like ATPase
MVPFHSTLDHTHRLPGKTMAITASSLSEALSLTEITAQLNRVVLGKAQQIELALACLLARGHLLVEDLPGMGKTTLAHALARVLGLHFQRIQFTSDLLPADVLGTSVYEPDRGGFRFHPGPVFSQLLLADEINRATPKTQSALLEAMEEQQVTTEGETRRLPQPFFVIATQNPQHQIGTYPLPESQLDRFTMRIRLGYPDHLAERELLQGSDRRALLSQLSPRTDPDALRRMQQAVRHVHVSEALLDYLQRILAYTRRPGLYADGLSPRAGLALLRAAQAWAWIHGQDHVLPEDLQAVLQAVASHRLHPLGSQPGNETEIMDELIAEIPVP